LIIVLYFVPLLAQPSLMSFGTGRSQIRFTSASEFQFWNIPFQMRHNRQPLLFFWITGDPIEGNTCGVDFAIWRFYVDGEMVPSVGPFQTSQAAFVGDNDPSAPWDNDFFGKNSKFGGWHINLFIPFSKSIRVTLQLPPQIASTRAFAMVRGVENIPITFGSVQLPSTARLHSFLKTSISLPVLGFHEMVDLKTEKGYLLGTMIDIVSEDNGSLNSLEGCWHAYFPGTQYAQYPGLLLGTGAEDYPESAYYFNAGPYRGPTSGLTVMVPGKNPGASKISFYKLHHKDPIFFRNGFRFEWRNGDVTDPKTGEKCTQITGSLIGRPGISNVTTLVYVYTY